MPLFFGIFFADPVGIQWLANYRATLPAHLLPGRCNVQFPHVRSAVSAYLGVASGMEIVFDTRLIRLGVNGRVLSLGFQEMRQMQIAVEWFVQNMDHFRYVCEQCYLTPLPQHTVFCRDGHTDPFGSPQVQPTLCVPIVRVDFSLLTQTQAPSGSSGSWVKRDRVLSLLFVDSVAVANMH